MSDSNRPSVDSLVAIVVAARRAGDRNLERQARRQLLDHHGLKLSFSGDRPSYQQQGNNDEE